MEEKEQNHFLSNSCRFFLEEPLDFQELVQGCSWCSSLLGCPHWTRCVVAASGAGGEAERAHQGVKAGGCDKRGPCVCIQLCWDCWHSNAP